MTLTVVAADSGLTPRRRSVGVVASSAVLARRSIRSALRSGDVVLALLSPVVFFVCFHTPLQRRFEAAGIDYAQYLTPVILVQACLFTAIAASEVAAGDARSGARERMLSLPMSRVAPVVGRMSWVVLRMLISTASGMAVAAAFGFRLRGSAADTVGVVVVLVVVAVAVSLMTDAIGTVVRGSVAGVLMIPQLVLVMASTGLVPADGFPGWAQPVVRNQPVSVVTDAIRGLAAGTDVDLTGAVMWTAVLLVVGSAAVAAAARAGTSR
ncbi:ABC transporter permease [Williamsia sp. SKLECPSW1]